MSGYIACNFMCKIEVYSLCPYNGWVPVAASREGDGGICHPPPVGGSASHLPPPPPSEEKNDQNQPFSANFWIFAPSEMHFTPSMPPQKIFWCRHWWVLIISIRFVLVSEQASTRSRSMVK